MRLNSALVSDRRPLGIKVTIAAILGALIAAPAIAHVVLDAPNGGEILEPGSVFTIVWHDSVYHGPANYDLWYSTTGQDGPWIVIVANITPGGPMSSYDYEWTVPDTPSDHVRVRVQQDNSDTDYVDISDMDLAIGIQPTASRVFIPSAAHVAGAGGSFFVTTVDVHNPGSSTAVLRFEWLPRNTDNSVPVQSADYELAAGETMRFPSFLEDVFGLTNAVGAAAVLSDTQGLKVMSRTFNQTADGTFGQSLPGVSEHGLIPATTRALILFLTEDGEFRSNLGLVNGVGSPITIRWELFASDGSSLATGSTDLPPWGNKQLNRVLADFAPIAAAYAHVWTTTPGGAFTCYGSVLDELTSDPTTVPPQ